MMIGPGRSSEENEAGVAVSFRHVTQHLVVRAVLFDDVDHVFEGRIRGCGPALFPVVRLRDATRIFRQAVRSEAVRDDPQCPIQLTQVVSVRPGNSFAWDGSVWICMAAMSLAAQNQKLASVIQNSRRVPIGGNAAFERPLS